MMEYENNLKLMAVNKMKYLLVIAVVFCTACETAYKINYVTEPRGGYVTYTRTGDAVGIAPKIVNYGNNASYKSGGCYQVAPVTATWASGASVSHTQNTKLCGGVRTYTVTLSRPANYPGLQTDLQLAIQLEQNEADRKLQSDAAFFNAYMMMRPKTTTGTIRAIDENTIIYRETTK